MCNNGKAEKIRKQKKHEQELSSKTALGYTTRDDGPVDPEAAVSLLHSEIRKFSFLFLIQREGLKR